MTPQEISDYRLKWLHRACIIEFNESYYDQVSLWCRRNLPLQSWFIRRHTNVFVHTLCVENPEMKKLFIKEKMSEIKHGQKKDN